MNRWFFVKFALFLILIINICVYGVSDDVNEVILKAKQGDAKAQNYLGVRYDNGEGVNQDYAEAVKWYTKAAEQGYASAQYRLGEMYYFGQGVEHDYKVSVKWYTKAAEQGYAYAQYRLGEMYYLGQGVEKDYKKSIKWYTKAAEQGDADAPAFLWRMYYKGQGVIENYIEAYKWILLASMNGYDISESKNLLKRSMTGSQIAEAQRLAKEFSEKIEKAAAQSNDEKQIKSSGTGFIVDPNGYLVTACHVVDQAKSIVVITNNDRFKAEIVAKDKSNDFAILKIEGMKFSSLNIASSSRVKTGDQVFTIGFPNIDIQGTEAKYTEGSISSLSGINNDFRHFQISVPVQSGNSGGPLVNSNGNVVGVIVSKLSDTQMLLQKGDVPQNVNYAVKSSFVLPYVESIHGIKVGDKVDKKPDNAVIPKVKNATVLILCY